jgi:hypothetical protein
LFGLNIIANNIYIIYLLIGSGAVVAQELQIIWRTENSNEGRIDFRFIPVDISRKFVFYSRGQTFSRK